MHILYCKYGGEGSAALISKYENEKIFLILKITLNAKRVLTGITSNGFSIDID